MPVWPDSEWSMTESAMAFRWNQELRWPQAVSKALRQHLRFLLPRAEGMALAQLLEAQAHCTRPRPS